VYVWDLSTPLDVVNDPKALAEYHKNSKTQSIQPLFSFSGHGVEGFAMDWCPLVSGKCRSSLTLQAITLYPKLAHHDFKFYL